jgi:hypothetical protein
MALTELSSIRGELVFTDRLPGETTMGGSARWRSLLERRKRTDCISREARS